MKHVSCQRITMLLQGLGCGLRGAVIRRRDACLGGDGWSNLRPLHGTDRWQSLSRHTSRSRVMSRPRPGRRDPCRAHAGPPDRAEDSRSSICSSTKRSTGPGRASPPSAISRSLLCWPGPSRSPSASAAARKPASARRRRSSISARASSSMRWRGSSTTRRSPSMPRCRSRWRPARCSRRASSRPMCRSCSSGRSRSSPM